MRFSDLLRVALRALRAHPLRAGLNLLGIVIAVTTIIAVISVVTGLNRYASDVFGQLGPHTMVKAVRERGVVLQTGTQQRSDRKFRLACELVRNGRIGKLQQVTVFVPAGIRGGPFPPQPPPAGFNGTTGSVRRHKWNT